MGEVVRAENYTSRSDFHAQLAGVQSEIALVESEGTCRTAVYMRVSYLDVLIRNTHLILPSDLRAQNVFERLQ